MVDAVGARELQASRGGELVSVDEDALTDATQTTLEIAGNINAKP